MKTIPLTFEEIAARQAAGLPTKFGPWTYSPVTGIPKGYLGEGVLYMGLLHMDGHVMDLIYSDRVERVLVDVE